MVNGVVHPIVDSGGKLVLLGLETGSEDVVAIPERRHGIVEGTADIVLGVVDDASFVFIPQHRHGDPPEGAGTVLAVGFAEKLEAVPRILRAARSVAKGPAALVADGIEDSKADCLL